MMFCVLPVLRLAESLHDQVCTFSTVRRNLSFRVNPQKERKSIANFSKMRNFDSNLFECVQKCLYFHKPVHIFCLNARNRASSMTILSSSNFHKHEHLIVNRLPDSHCRNMLRGLAFHGIPLLQIDWIDKKCYDVGGVVCLKLCFYNNTELRLEGVAC